MKSKTSPWRIERVAASALTLHVAGPTSALAISDLHWDNAHCDRAALKRDLDAAKEKNAPIFLFGDTFCAMQGKWDKRKDEKQLRKEHRGGRYLDLLVDTAAEWFAPYAANIALITYGNHETSILSHHQTDLVQRFHQSLRAVPGYGGEVGAYAGFIKVLYSDATRTRANKIIYWNHGSGGGGEVTRGLIDHSRTRSQVNADIYISGHIHRRNMDENVVEELNPENMTIIQRRQWFLRCSTYKQEDGAAEGDISGWHVERGRASRPVGGWWLNFQPSHSGKLSQYLLNFTPTPTSG